MMIIEAQNMRTDREDPPTDLDLVKMKRRERAGLKALGVVGVAVAALVVGMNVGRADVADRVQLHNTAVVDAVHGAYGPGRDELTAGEASALGAVYAFQQRTNVDCTAVVTELIATRDYRHGMAWCLGEEDSPAVDAVLGEGR